ncbi:MAG: dTDP-4-dehydrorhamnose reductase [Chloroflexi bacterium]|nr:dTDP-4-dehydrorhamnose reductase [Chloroflexota bacterium]
MAIPMNILLLGKNGQIGGELAKLLPDLGTVMAIGREECDLADWAWLRTTIRLLEPQLIVNAAAFTSIDRAEDHPLLARSVNSVAPAIIAEEAAKLGARLIHYSTDYVFDGSNKEPYTEDDEPNPLNVYGATKLEGEQAIQASGAAAMILRTSWVYGLQAESFVSKVFRWSAADSERMIAVDQISRPTWSVRVAQATVEIIKQNMRWGDFKAHWRGVYHLASTGAASRYAWAKAINHHTAQEPPPKLVPALSEELPTYAERPNYSVLDCTKLEETFGIRLPDWRDDLSLALSARHLPDFVPAKLELA